jgi:hypothetical protein
MQNAVIQAGLNGLFAAVPSSEYRFSFVREGQQFQFQYTDELLERYF